MTGGSGLVILLATLAGCSRAGTTGDPVGSAAPRTEHRGKVVIGGSEPGTSVQLVSGGARLELVGALEPELRRLAGAQLLARGSLQGRPPIQRLEVHEYDITEIDGKSPFVGVTHFLDGQLWLTGADTLALFGMPENFRAGDGAKLWIVGARSGDTLTVQSYGVIRE